MENGIEKTIGNSMIIVGIFYTVARIVHIIGGKLNDWSGRDHDDIDDEMKTVKGLVTAAAKSIAIYIAILFIIFAIMFLFIFYYCATFTQGGFYVALMRTVSLLNNILWKNGELMFLYISLSISLFIMFAVLSIYALQNKKDFVEKIRLPTNAANETSDEESKGPNQEVLFYKHFMLFVFIVFLFLFMMTILGIWSTCKISLMYYIMLIFGIVITTVISFEKYVLTFLVYIMIVATYVKTLYPSC
jgi:hypothetical protein